ncbi:SUMF1/EgtB/PvdO family nonheme iron enzyme [Desulforhopalus vacuolatus]|uniref:formylglycine-generating enzyme family protein n=1 Tax=Desulforhopalus vacuolatus TaxID=40414 RepID=UPI00196364F1|nr:SUMF1/EgtB/PvdO family nonheme iron enzyme [Desulforhopalus vacuolatus]MBM9519224.1 SUMF1/EgtB/PvdO family nonheme iron enzyme [Desulforhopalus vacuolatus]
MSRSSIFFSVTALAAFMQLLLISPVSAQISATWIDPTTGMEFVLVKGGCYQMGDTFGEGDSDEKPVHEVCVDDFYMEKYEVTQGEWQKIMGSNPSSFKNGDHYPVENVSWDDITENFLPKLNRSSGKRYRLPTEAEWEYAARERGKKVRFGNGKDIADPREINFDGRAWGKESYSRTGVSREKTTKVGSFAPNRLGLYDMSGNVWEWCQDDWHNSYNGAPRYGSSWGNGSGSFRVFRGGGWFNSPGYVRAALRYCSSPDFSYSNLGFRLVFPVH